jgi:hypothetical protein
MKKLLIFVLGLSWFQSQAQDDIQAGTIQFSASEINYGIIEKDSDPFREVTITNIGNYPLIINSCRASCGCTVPNCPVEAIPPKKKSVIKVRYNTSNIGAFNKTITVYSNDQNNPVTLIRIYGEVKAPANK